MLEDSAVGSGNAGKNAMIHELLTILKEHGYELELDFAIELDENGELCFNVSGTAVLCTMETPAISPLASKTAAIVSSSISEAIVS